MEQRIAELDRFVIARGGHADLEAGACAMELVSWLAGEEFSDHPKCTSKVIGGFVIRWSDAMNDEDRQILKPLLPRLVGTAGTAELERIRAYMAADWASRTAVPIWLRACGMKDEAEQLERLTAVADRATAEEASKALRLVRDIAYKLREQRRQAFIERLRDAGAAGAAWDAGDAGAAGDAWAAWAAWAAWDAWDAWDAGAAGAAWAAWDAGAAGAAGAAWDAGAAGDAWAADGRLAALVDRLKLAKNYDEAYRITYDFSRPLYDEWFEKHFSGVVKELQQSALGLLEQMVEAKEPATASSAR
jgi:hypothetical protein